MKMHGCKYLLLAVGVLLSATSIARVSTKVPDKTDECLGKVDWASDAFRSKDDWTKVFVKSESFEKLVACAYGTIFNSDEIAEQRAGRQNARMLKAAKDLRLQGSWPDSLFDKAIASDDVDLLIGPDTRHEPTFFVHAVYDKQGTRPIGSVIRGYVSYIRSPAYPGFCDDLKSNAISYEWCTGARGPSTKDPSLIKCENKDCDEPWPDD